MLRSVFNDCVEKQRTQPQYDWQIAVKEPVEGFEEFSQWFFFSEVGRVLTNRPNLSIGFKFDEEQNNRFLQLSISSEFKIDEDEVDDCHAYFAECGDNADKAAQLVYEVLTHVYQLGNFPTFANQKFGNERDKKALKGYFIDHLPMMFCFDLPSDTDMTKIRQQFEKTAACMEKYGFGQVEIDQLKRCVKGYYQPTEEPKGFLASIKHGGQLGDAEGELVALLDLCYHSFK